MMRKLMLAALSVMLAWPAMAQTPGHAPARPAAQAPARTQPAAPAAAPTAAPAAAPAPASAPAAAGGKVNVNAAPAAQLETLPGVGPARSKAIVAARPFAALDELVKKKALPQGVFDSVKGQLALANINSSTAAEMEKTLPGIGDVRSKAIVAGRPYAGPQELVTKGVLTQPVLDRIKELIAF